MNNTNTATNAGVATQAHPFEISGMGVGPYRFVGIYEMPTPGDGSAAMFANADPFSEIRALVLKAGAGTCACCGMAITVICVVIDGVGDRWGVGSDCIEKIGEPALCNAAKVAVAKRRAKMARSRRDEKCAAQRQAWLAAPSDKSGSLPGETNGARLAREDAEQLTAANARKNAAAQRGAILAPFSDAIADGRNGFCDSIARDFRRGNIPTGRGLSLAREIYGKRFGRVNSTAWESAVEQFDAAIESADELESFAASLNRNLKASLPPV